MNSCTRLRVFPILFYASTISACAIDNDNDINDDDDESAEDAYYLRHNASNEMTDTLDCGMPEGQMPEGILGIDSNQVAAPNALGNPDKPDVPNLNMHYTTEHGAKWVGRYISWNGCGPHRKNTCKARPGKPTLPVNPPITPTEVQQWLHRGVSVAFLWELHGVLHACSARKIQDEKALGRADGLAAQNYMHDTLGAPPSVAVYFTVDFNLTDDMPASECTNPKEKILAYFQGIQQGIKQGLDEERTRRRGHSSRNMEMDRPIGVYGSYETVRELLDKTARHEASVQYAWQQTFHCSADHQQAPIDSRADLWQYDILFTPAPYTWLGHPAAGGLDFDVAVHDFAGMWKPGM